MPPGVRARRILFSFPWRLTIRLDMPMMPHTSPPVCLQIILSTIFRVIFPPPTILDQLIPYLSNNSRLTKAPSLSIPPMYESLHGQAEEACAYDYRTGCSNSKHAQLLLARRRRRRRRSRVCSKRLRLQRSLSRLSTIRGRESGFDTSPFGVFAGGVIISNTVNLQTATCTVGR